MAQFRNARFHIGQIVRHYDGAFQGAVLDVDPVYDGSVQQEGLIAPDQPFYRVYAIGENGGFVAYAAEAALRDASHALTLSEADQRRWFSVDAAGHHAPMDQPIH
jgi:heat shock protein HspQ